MRATSLLGPGDPAALACVNPDGRSDFFLTCEHAGTAIPSALGDLGLAPGELERHIGWDIGALEVAKHLSGALDAPLFHQTYSRLVIDCNRMPSAHDIIPTRSDGTAIPGNRDLEAVHIAARHQEIFRPYHDAITETLDRRAGEGRRTILVSIHSFTPHMDGHDRPWHIGVLYKRSPTYPRLLLDALRPEPGLVTGDNQPYAITDGKDYAIPVHGEHRGIPNVEIEIRQDLITEAAGQAAYATLLARALAAAAQGLS